MLKKLNDLLKGGVDPKWIVVLAWLVGVQKGIGQGAISLTNMVPDSWIPHVIAWNNGLAWLGVGLMGLFAALSSNASGPLISVPNIQLSSIDTKAVAKVLLVAFALSVFFAGGSAMAQIQIKTPQQMINDLRAENATLKQQVTTVVTPAPASDAPLACDFKMFTHFTPENLIPTLKGCFANGDAKIVKDATNALASAKAFKGNIGDGDGINCLTPGLEIIKAGAVIAYVPAVMSTDGTTVMTPEVPAQDPGLITLYQKYREFTLAGGLTACQTWFNGPINATAAAGAGGVATAIGAAALLPK